MPRIVRIRRILRADGGRAWLRLVGLALLASLVAVPGELGAKAPPKQRSTARYTLTLQFEGDVKYESKGTAGDVHVEAKGEATTAWTGTSKPFLLVNYGSRSQPNIRISGSPRVDIAGFLDHKGKGSGTVSGPRITCTYPIAESAGEASARAQVTLALNRLQIRMIPEGTARIAYGPDSCTGETTVKSCNECLALPERRGFGPEYWRKYGMIDPREIKFGRAFTIMKIRDPIMQPGFEPALAPLVYWSFRWVLRFRPVKT